MANKYIVLDWQEVLYDEYMVFRKRSASCAPTTERTIHSAIFSFFTYIRDLILFKRECGAVYKHGEVLLGQFDQFCRNTEYRGCFAKVAQDKCVGCGKCEKVCPANSITMESRENI